MAQDDFGEFMIRGGGAEQIGIQHGRVTDSRESRGIVPAGLGGEQMEELWIMHDFGFAGVGEPVFHRLQGFIVEIVRGNLRGADCC